MLGPADRVESVLEGLLVDRGARQEFEPFEPPPVTPEGRTDLRELTTFTIDPDTAKDFDDAISVVREGDGMRAWVHIADVSHFVAPGSPLDRGAAGRAFSTYVPGLVAPMLPPELSNDLCSLKEGVDRLCVTVEFPPEGEPNFYRSVIRSNARLTYGQAQRRDVPPWVADELELAAAYSADLRRKRFARGALRVERPELEFEFDGQGGVAAATWQGEPESHALVEELMIVANEAVAELLSSRRREALYRVHERPDPQSVQLLLAKLAELDVPTPAAPDELAPALASKVVAEASDGIDRLCPAHRPGPGGFSGARPPQPEAGALRPPQPRPLRPRQHCVLPLHEPDPPLPRPRRPPRAPPRARRDGRACSAGSRRPR